MGDPRIDRIAARQAAQTAATHLTVAPLMADTAKMSDEQVGKLTALFDVFDPDGHAYSVGDVASYDGVLYRVVQAHRSQADWTPDKVPALWTPVRKVAGAAPDEWVQPVGASDAYRKGDRVLFQGATYESVIDANTWSPAAYPAGWKKL